MKDASWSLHFWCTIDVHHDCDEFKIRENRKCAPRCSGKHFFEGGMFDLQFRDEIMKNDENRKCAPRLGRKHNFANFIIEPRSGVNSYFAFRSASAERNENHKIQVHGRFGAAGRNAQGRWGEIWGGLEICRFEICNYGLVLSIRHASSCHTARAADSIAPRIPPGLASIPYFTPFSAFRAIEKW